MLKNDRHRKYQQGSGFTLIEIMLVIVIIGVMVAVIIPRALRASVDTKYNMVRQEAAELGKWGVAWAERQLELQQQTDTCNLNDYVATLAGYVGNSSNTNWPARTSPALVTPACHGSGALNTAVQDTTPQDVVLRNPFNGVAYFNSVHNGGTVTAGLLYLAVVNDGTFDHYYFVFTGTDSNAADQWHAGMGSGTSPSLEQLRNGIFMARLQ